MTIYEKIRDYRELCGVTRKEVKTLGGYSKSEQYYGQCEMGQYDLTEDKVKEMYDCINVARAEKMKQTENNG